MKLVTFREGNAERFGALLGDDRVLDLATAFAWHEQDQKTGHDVGEKYGRDLVGFIDRQDVAMPVATALLARANEGALATLPLAQVQLLSPIPRPPSMRDGYAFRQHVLTARRNRGLEMIPEFDQFPVFYFTNHHGVIGPGDVRVLPLHLERLDYELEAAIVVGRRGRNVKAANADSHVFGLTIMNDWSARALQMEEMKLSLGPAKGKDFATALGPYLVTLDELADKTKETPNGKVFDLTMTASINGKEYSRGNVAEMNWTFAQILERVSYGVDLHVGDVIGSGTVGTGCLLELNGSKVTDNLWLKVGDVVSMQIERLGALENRVVAEEV